MTPRILTITEKKLIGRHLTMSLANNRTAELWKGFMPFRKDIVNRVSDDLFSMQVYKPGYFSAFNPSNEFEKWAAMEVWDFSMVPEAMETFNLEGGLYAVFDYKGSSRDSRIFEYIFTTWLPTSGYLLDNRPHFELLGKKYKNDDPDSEEEIWIPIRTK